MHAPVRSAVPQREEVHMLDNKAAAQRSRRLILVIEDNEINREMLVALLEEQGYDVIEAENGLEGLEQLERHYDELSLVLLDVFMPVMNGLEFLSRKREDERFDSVPVIVITANNTEADELKALKLGANDFVVKPYNFEVMMNRIYNMISLRESASIVNLLTMDTNTALYSKGFFDRAVGDELAANPDGAYDMVCSDIDNFRSLNDRYGQERCDQLLGMLADNLMDAIPDLVSGGRIGGDQFAFLIKHQEKPFDDALREAVESIGHTNLSVKFGIVENFGHELEPSTVCGRALLALERVKGPLGVVISRYDEKLHESQLLERQILENMEEALAQRQFTVYYQPKHDMRNDVTGGAEALVRWIHPELGFINPGAFIEIFEHNGFITQLDMYVYEEVCRHIKRREEAGLPAIPISVNASRLDFDIPDLPEQLAAMADRYDVDHSLLHIELTETAYADDPKTVSDALHRLRESGFRIELDDFGSGFSSLASLNTLPLDVMKLDMSLVRQAEKLDDFRIVESTIKLAQILGLQVVVEGVETLEVAERLRDMNCDYIQGYYYSRPLKSEEFDAYLTR